MRSYECELKNKNILKTIIIILFLIMKKIYNQKKDKQIIKILKNKYK